MDLAFGIEFNYSNIDWMFNVGMGVWDMRQTEVAEPTSYFHRDKPGPGIIPLAALYFVNSTSNAMLRAHDESGVFGLTYLGP